MHLELHGNRPVGDEAMLNDNTCAVGLEVGNGFSRGYNKRATGDPLIAVADLEINAAPSVHVRGLTFVIGQYYIEPSWVRRAGHLAPE
jgi:hypothetical protein